MGNLFDRILKAKGEELKELRALIEAHFQDERDPELREPSALPKEKSRHNFTPRERIELDHNGKFDPS